MMQRVTPRIFGPIPDHLKPPDWFNDPLDSRNHPNRPKGEDKP